MPLLLNVVGKHTCVAVFPARLSLQICPKTILEVKRDFRQPFSATLTEIALRMLLTSFADFVAGPSRQR